MRFQRMAQRLFGDNFVAVLSPYLFAAKKPLLFQLVDDPLNRPLGDAHAQGNLAQYQLGFGIQDDQYVRVVGQKRPSSRQLGSGR